MKAFLLAGRYENRALLATGELTVDIPLIAWSTSGEREVWRLHMGASHVQLEYGNGSAGEAVLLAVGSAQLPTIPVTSRIKVSGVWYTLMDNPAWPRRPPRGGWLC